MNMNQIVRQHIRRLYPKTVILLYHRVAECRLDPEQLCVTPEHFAEQMACLRKHFNVRCLHNLHRWDTNSGIVVTFDDGYSDNLYHALPVLEEYDIPATIFVSSYYIETGNPFWWDVLAAALLAAPIVPAQLTVRLQGQPYYHGTGSEDEQIQAYRELLAKAHYLNASEIEQFVFDLRQWAALHHWEDSWGRPLALNELRSLAQSALVDIGAHTQKHLNLARQSRTVQSAEIQIGQQQLEAWLGRPVASFAYPFGFPDLHYNADTIRAVQAAGFLRACANQEGWVTWRSDRFQYSRYLVRDWNGDEFMKHLSAWFAA